MACAPRGESHSLSQVLESAKFRYAKVQQVQVPGDLMPNLQVLVGSLESLLKNSVSSAKSDAKQVASAIDILVGHAGYTNRPAFGELLYQYLAISNGETSRVSDATIKLLVSRTYSLLASELETTQFKI